MKNLFVVILTVIMCLSLCACAIKDTNESTTNTENMDYSEPLATTENRLSDHPLVAHFTGEWALDSNAELEEAPYTHLLFRDDGSGVIDGVSVTWEISDKYTSEESIHIDIYTGTEFIGSVVYWSKSQLVQIVDENGNLLECYYHRIAHATA